MDQQPDKQPTLSRAQLGGVMLGGIAALTASPLLAQADTGRVPFSGSTAFEILTNDHRRIARYLERLVHEPAARHETMMSLGLLFTIHNATEENFIYPAVGKVAMLPEDASALYHQQDGAKEVVWSLHEIGKTDGYRSHRFTRTAERLLLAATAHVHQEESRDFPRLRDALTAHQLAELTQEVRRFRQHFA